MTITVYTKPGCFGCRKTIEKFRDAGIDPAVVDVSVTPAALDYITGDLGYTQAPVVVVDDHFHWSGLDPANITRTITAHQDTSGQGPGREAQGRSTA